MPRLKLPGELGIDRIAIEFTLTEHQILLVTVTNLLTNKVLVKQRSIDKNSID